jgi:hypothetical protein
MAEFVLGTGSRKSIRDCVRIIEQHLVRVEGNPRKVLLRAENFEVLPSAANIVVNLTSIR